MCIIHKGFRGFRAFSPASILGGNLIGLKSTIPYEIIHLTLCLIFYMSKKLTILALVFFIPAISFSQIQLGVKGGYNYYFIIDKGNGSGHYNATYSPIQHSFCTSLFVSDQLTKVLRPTIEIEYLSLSFGVKSSWGGLGSGKQANYDYTLGYISLILIPKLVFGKKVQFLLSPGLCFSFLSNSKVVGYSSQWSLNNLKLDTTYYNGSAQGEIYSPSMGVVLGFGISIPITPSFYLIAENYNSIYFNNTAHNTHWGGSCNFLNMRISIGLVYKFKSGIFKRKNEA